MDAAECKARPWQGGGARRARPGPLLLHCNRAAPREGDQVHQVCGWRHNQGRRSRCWKRSDTAARRHGACCKRKVEDSPAFSSGAAASWWWSGDLGALGLCGTVALRWWLSPSPSRERAGRGRAATVECSQMPSREWRRKRERGQRPGPGGLRGAGPYVDSTCCGTERTRGRHVAAGAEADSSRGPHGPHQGQGVTGGVVTGCHSRPAGQ